MSQNVPVTSIVKLCGNSTVVVLLSMIMEALFLRTLVRGLVAIRQRGIVTDVLAYNQRRAEALYSVQFLTFIIFPVLMQFILDENCLR